MPPSVIAAMAAAAAVTAAAPPSLPSPHAAPPAYAPAAHAASVAQMTALGRLMFFDPGLSASGRQSCASCHSPGHAYGPPNDLAVQLGGPDLKTPGTRAVPSLRYLQAAPPFSQHFHDDDGDDSVDAGPTGGLTWDGRADSAHAQARIPLLAPNEMANASVAQVVAKVRQAPYAPQFRAAFGVDVFDHPARAFRAVLMALEVFQQSPADFYPYSSKYDAYLRGQVRLSPQEARGLALFNDPGKGNCASCHVSEIAPNGAFPSFTDFGLVALGVPRNRAIPANADPHYVDLGLCGPERTDFAGRADYCGLFKTPTLRNVALRHTFFHNGVFHSLKEVLQFYAQRDTQPEKWYPRRRDGSIAKFDDLLPAYRGNVNMDPPFGRRAGQKPALSDAEIDDIIAFLKTLTDGYRASSLARCKHADGALPLRQKRHP